MRSRTACRVDGAAAHGQKVSSSVGTRRDDDIRSWRVDRRLHWILPWRGHEFLTSALGWRPQLRPHDHRTRNVLRCKDHPSIDLGSRLARSIALQWKLCANIADLIPTMCCQGESRELSFLAVSNFSGRLLAGQPYPRPQGRLRAASPQPRGQHNCPSMFGLDGLSVVEQRNLLALRSEFTSTSCTRTTASQTNASVESKRSIGKEDIAMLQLSL